MNGMSPESTRIGKRTAWWITSFAGVALALGSGGGAAVAQVLRYPVTPAGDRVDDYFGTRVPDPYRWLESDTASAVRRWIEEQNAVTFRYLDSIPFRPALKERLTELMDYRRSTLPSRHRQWFVFSQNDGLQNQNVLHIQRGFGGTPEVLLDPNRLSPDGTTRLAMTSLSHDARYLAYGLSSGGSDWMEIRVMEIAGRKEQPDRLQWVKVSGAAWWGNGFFYSRFDAPKDPAGALTAANEHHRVFYHRVGTPQSADSLVFEDPANPRRFHSAATSDDGRFLYLSVSDGSKGSDGNALYVMDLHRAARAFVPITEGFEHQFRVLDNLGDQLIVLTDSGAPNRRVVLVDLEKPEESHWRTILPERREPLRSALFAGGKLIVSYMKDVTSRVYTYDLNGIQQKEVALPGPGTVAGFSGRPNDPRVFFAFSSFTAPPTTYLYDILEDTLAVY
jgi:prolyl oligopeptidase